MAGAGRIRSPHGRRPRGRDEDGRIRSQSDRTARVLGAIVPAERAPARKTPRRPAGRRLAERSARLDVEIRCGRCRRWWRSSPEARMRVDDGRPWLFATEFPKSKFENPATSNSATDVAIDVAGVLRLVGDPHVRAAVPGVRGVTLDGTPVARHDLLLLAGDRHARETPRARIALATGEKNRRQSRHRRAAQPVPHRVSSSCQFVTSIACPREASQGA